MAIRLTKTAAKRIESMLSKQSDAIGLRLGTKKTGCSGMAYVVEYANKVNEDDVVFEDHGVKLVIDRNSLPILDGMQIDYVKSNSLNEGFEFNNPNIKEVCGCGESFNV